MQARTEREELLVLKILMPLLKETTDLRIRSIRGFASFQQLD